MNFQGRTITVNFENVKRKAFVVVDEKGHKRFSKIPDGLTLAGDMNVKRDVGKHNRLFKAISVCYHSKPEGFDWKGNHIAFPPEVEDGEGMFYEWIKWEVGFIEKTFWMENGVLKQSQRTKSLAFERCPNDEFEWFVEAAFAIMGEIMGIDPKQFYREVFDLSGAAFTR